MTWPTKQHIAAVILLLAGTVLVSTLAWHWYYTQKNYFVSGAPPQALMDKIEPKKVPYNQIKPPAFLPTDALIFGSVSSTVGIVFFGDYADKTSNSLALELESWVKKSGSGVRFIWHYLPASTDDGDVSFEAAVLSECSRLIDKTWPAHSLLIGSEKVTGQEIEFLTDRLADKDGLLYACRRDKNIRDYLKHNIEIARGDGIDKTPFVFVGAQVFPASNASSTPIIKAAQGYLH